MNLKIERYNSNEIYTMNSVDQDFSTTKDDLERIAQICNEPAVHEIIKKVVGERPYTSDDAARFVNWAKEGWQKDLYYVFLVRDKQNKICAAIDIKGTNVGDSSREIGYWASSDTRGIMTNSVKQLLEFARTKNFSKLYGLVDPGNDKSMNVLVRAGYVNVGEVLDNGKKYIRFEMET